MRTEAHEPDWKKIAGEPSRQFTISSEEYDDTMAVHPLAGDVARVQRIEAHGDDVSVKVETIRIDWERLIAESNDTAVA